jgi:hypothetical protein
MNNTYHVGGVANFSHNHGLKLRCTGWLAKSKLLPMARAVLDHSDEVFA